MTEQDPTISPAIEQALCVLEEEGVIWSPYYACISVPFSRADLAEWIVTPANFSESDWNLFVSLAIARGTITATDQPGMYRFAD